jgi:hypothetical protein
MVVYVYYILCKVRCVGVLESLEHLNTSLYREYNKYRPPSDKGESLEHVNTSLYSVYNKHRPLSDKGESLEHLNTSL